MVTSSTLYNRKLEGLPVEISFDAVHAGAVKDAYVDNLSIQHDGIELYELLCQETIDVVLEWCHQYIAADLAEQIAEKWSFRPEEV